MGEITASRHRMRPATKGIYRAVGMLGSAQGLGMVCSLVRNKLVAIWVGESGIALLGLLNSAVEMIGSLAQQGLRTSAVGPVAEAASTPRLGRVAASVVSCGFAVGLASAVIMLLAAPVLSHISFGSGIYTWAFAAMALAVLLNAVTASRQAIAQGTGALARIARASLTGSLAGMIISVPLLWFFRIDALPWVIVTYSAVTAAAYFFPALRLPSVSMRETLAACSAILRLGLWLTLSSALGWGVSYLFMSWLHAEGGSIAVGLYQSGYTIAIRYLGVLFSAIAMEFYPRLSVRASRSPRHPSLLIAHETGVLLRVAVPASLLLIFLAPWVLKFLYSSDFAAATPFMVGALTALPLRALSWCSGFMIIARGDGPVFLAVEAASGATCLILSTVLYRMAGMAGLGMAFILWYLVYTAVILTVCNLRYNIKLPVSTMLYIVMSTLLLGGASLLRVNLC